MTESPSTETNGTASSDDAESEQAMDAEEVAAMLGLEGSAGPTTVGQMMTEMLGESRGPDAAGAPEESLREEVRRLRDEVHDARREMVRLADGVERIADALEE